MLVIWIIVFIMLVVSSYTDIKYGIIYPSLFICGAICCTVYSIFVLHNYNFIDSIISAVFVGSLFLIGTKFGGGGGDVIMMSLLSWIFGFKFSLYFCVFSLIEYLIGLVIIATQRKVSIKKLTLPYAPFALSGAVTTCLLSYFIGR